MSDTQRKETKGLAEKLDFISESGVLCFLESEELREAAERLCEQDAEIHKLKQQEQEQRAGCDANYKSYIEQLRRVNELEDEIEHVKVEREMLNEECRKAGAMLATDVDEINTLRRVITEALKAAPVGDVRKHTVENLPRIVADLSALTGEQGTELDALRRDRDRFFTALNHISAVADICFIL